MKEQKYISPDILQKAMENEMNFKETDTVFDKIEKLSKSLLILDFRHNDDKLSNRFTEVYSKIWKSDLYDKSNELVAYSLLSSIYELIRLKDYSYSQGINSQKKYEKDIGFILDLFDKSTGL